MKKITFTFYAAAFLFAAGTVGHFDTHPYAPISDAIGPLTVAALLAGAGAIYGYTDDVHRKDLPVQRMRRYPDNPYDWARKL